MGRKKESKDHEDEKKLQALLLADSFTNTFRPMTLEKPKMLCPLVGIPMLDYTIELLASSGVQELFVFCVNKADQMNDYIAKSHWPTTIQVTCIQSTVESVGEALREVDNRGVIRSDPFILVSGDVISNMDLKEAIRAHQENRSLDSYCVMTKVFKPVGGSTKLRLPTDDLCMALDAETSRIVYWQDDLEADRLAIPGEVLREHRGRSLELRCDLLETGIDVCSPDVLGAFTDNWDYLDLCKHFCKTEIANVELGSHIFAHVLPKGQYAARIHDPRLYAAVSTDVVGRWVHPFSPDNNFYGSHDFRLGRRNTYREPRALVNREAFIGDECVLSRGCSVSAGARLERCIVGRNCRIGEGAVLTDCILWEDVTVESHVTATNAILCDGATAKSRSELSRGCILSFNAVLGAGCSLAPFSRVTTAPPARGGGEGGVDGGGFGGEALSRRATVSPLGAAVAKDESIVGSDGLGRLWEPLEEDSEDEDDGWEEDEVDLSTAHAAQPPLALSVCARHSWGAHEVDSWRRSLHRRFPPDDLLEEEDALQAVGSAELTAEDFRAVITDMVVDHELHGGGDTENLFMEIKSIKFSQNREWSDCLRGLMAALLRSAGAEGASGMQLVQALRAQVAKWKAMARRMVLAPGDELGVIEVLEEAALDSGGEATWKGVFRFALQLLLQMEVLTDEGLELWIEERRAMDAARPEAALFANEDVQAFVEWLEDEEDDSDGSSSEGDSGEDSDEG